MRMEIGHERVRAGSKFLKGKEKKEVVTDVFSATRLAKHIQEKLDSGKDVILEIDWQGARQIRQLMSACRSIFIVPPSIPALRERLQGREQDSDDVIESRMREAVNEMTHYPEFDYIVINDDFEQARDELAAIFVCNRMRLERQQQSHADLLADLLEQSA